MVIMLACFTGWIVTQENHGRGVRASGYQKFLNLVSNILHLHRLWKSKA